MTDDCPFCAIEAGDAPASVVTGDEHTLAFMDINPVNPGHVLVVPRAHAPRLADLAEETGGHLFRVGTHVANALYESSIPTDGINFLVADGEAAGQEVFHLHRHVIPRRADDSVVMDANRDHPPRANLDERAAEVTNRL